VVWRVPRPGNALGFDFKFDFDFDFDFFFAERRQSYLTAERQ
jgi:hypothetical protein